jgi:hypothetical protein
MNHSCVFLASLTSKGLISRGESTRKLTRLESCKYDLVSVQSSFEVVFALTNKIVVIALLAVMSSKVPRRNLWRHFFDNIAKYSKGRYD